ncbi:four-carbon acid sugar kinase family protein [Klebsiella pneumoniae]|nr:four-carbon acid sugar kinase family protein [Klebsiella pneumoniae]
MFVGEQLLNESMRHHPVTPMEDAHRPLN